MIFFLLCTVCTHPSLCLLGFHAQLTICVDVSTCQNKQLTAATYDFVWLTVTCTINIVKDQTHSVLCSDSVIKVSVLCFS